jgi:hypothetical protein
MDTVCVPILDATQNPPVRVQLVADDDPKKSIARSWDVDRVITTFMGGIGWVLQPPGTASAPRVAIFLSHLIPGSEEVRTNVFARIVHREVVKEIKANSAWPKINGRDPFPAEFWCKLFRECTACALNQVLIGTKPSLVELCKFAHSHCVIDPEQKLLALAGLKLLQPKELSCLLDDHKFRKFLFGPSRVGMPGRAQEFGRHIAEFMKPEAPDYEDAVVMILASSYFRWVPLVLDAIVTKNFPILVAKATEKEITDADRDKVNRSLEQHENPAIVVGAPAPDLPPLPELEDFAVIPEKKKS